MDKLFRVIRLASQGYDGEASYSHPRGQLWLAEHDQFAYGDQVRWEVVRVFRTKSATLPVADAKDGVLFRIVQGSSSGSGAREPSK